MGVASRYRVVSLSPSGEDSYAALIEGRCYPLYFAPWWLDTVIPRGEFVSLVCYDGSHPLAVFVAHQRGRELITPTYCQYAGIYFLDDDLTPYVKQVITQVIHRELSSVVYYHLNYSPRYIDWLGLHWLGYAQTTRYNYVWDITSLLTADDILSAISSSLRKNLKATERAGFVYLSSVPLDRAELIFSSTASYKGYKSDVALMRRLMERGLERSTARVVGIASATGELAMVAFWVEHQGVAYLIGEGTDRSVGGKYQLKVLMLTHYILSRPQTIHTIDFEGSMLEPIAKIYQALGAEQQSYMTITKGWRYHPAILWDKLLGRVSNLI